MHQLLKQILVIISALMLVVASGGFSLIHHYCGCSDNNNLSLMMEDESCHENDADHCCNVSITDQKETCCDKQNMNAHHVHQPCGDEHNCCSSEYLYFKTDHFDLSGKKVIKFNFIVAYVHEVSTEKFQNTISESFIHQINKDLPPPNYGNNLLVAIHQLKIASLLV